ncbi:hypothetical protein [Laspinema olomoucense]|nr:MULTISPECIES: hypothetical protein [unclassified Laspinema]MCT7974940.1 hypothetical protein [Laspinema sp. D3d]MCT7988166.1 hypothetical protein [Laspinema sp. D3a]MCT7994734.1 hypothetical protein [Laspinema sp. D3c]
MVAIITSNRGNDPVGWTCFGGAVFESTFYDDFRGFDCHWQLLLEELESF